MILKAADLFLLSLIMVSVLTQVSRWAGTGNIQSCTLTVASILAVHLQTWVLVDFTVSACTQRERERVREKVYIEVKLINRCLPAS